MHGLKVAACYSYFPARLGFCGARRKNTPKVLANYICRKEKSLTKIRKALESFEASYPYYQLIAKANQIKDPLDYKVVEAYWLGNSLLEKVKLADLRELILNEFTRPGLLSRKQAEKKSSLISPRARVHHSLHVLTLGSITGRVKFTPRLYDLCRIGWGEVTKVNPPAGGQKLKVETRPLLVKNNKFLLGKEVEKEIDWDKRFLPRVKVGDKVTFHWNFACQRITEKKERNLLKYTQLNVKATNEQRK